MSFVALRTTAGGVFCAGDWNGVPIPRYAVSPNPISWLIGETPSVKYTPC
jgi:hypothetical protein